MRVWLLLGITKRHIPKAYANLILLLGTHALLSKEPDGGLFEGIRQITYGPMDETRFANIFLGFGQETLIRAIANYNVTLALDKTPFSYASW